MTNTWQESDGSQIDAIAKAARDKCPNNVGDALAWALRKVNRSKPLRDAVLEESLSVAIKYYIDLSMRQDRSTRFDQVLKPGEVAELSKEKKLAYKYPELQWANIPLAGGKCIHDCTKEEIMKWATHMLSQGNEMVRRGSWAMGVAALLKKGETPQQHGVKEATYARLMSEKVA